jgi:hypothetical protein
MTLKLETKAFFQGSEIDFIPEVIDHTEEIAVLKINLPREDSDSKALPISVHRGP